MDRSDPRIEFIHISTYELPQSISRIGVSFHVRLLLLHFSARHPSFHYYRRSTSVSSTCDRCVSIPNAFTNLTFQHLSYAAADRDMSNQLALQVKGANRFQKAYNTTWKQAKEYVFLLVYRFLKASSLHVKISTYQGHRNVPWCSCISRC